MPYPFLFGARSMMRSRGIGLDMSGSLTVGWVVRAAVLIGVMLISAQVMGQSTEDTVIRRRAGSEKTAKRRGTIIEWKGASLTIEVNGTEREIDNEEIVDIQTAWSDAYQAGVLLQKKGDPAGAIEKFQAALGLENRPWAKRIIRSHLIDAFQTVNQPGAAVDQFLQIIQEDPNTRFLYLAPLPWAGSGVSLDGQAQRWIASRVPVVQLIGASWMLGGPQRAEGVKVLGELTLDIDPRIKNLATAQLWRTRANVNSKQVQVWQGIVNQMSRQFRAGPYFVLSEFQARTEQKNEALISLMRIPILYSEQRSLAAAALYRAAGLLRQQGEMKQAQILVNELIMKYPQTLWAQQSSQSIK